MWIDRGLPVFPIAISWDESKGKTNKRPLTDHGYKDATTDRARFNESVHDAFTRLKTGEILACATVPGAGGYVVFDDDNDPAMRVLDDDLRLPPHTYSPRTGSGCEHRWLNKRADVHVSNRSPWEKQSVDIRSDAGYVVCPGTVTPWGEWTDGDDQRPWGTFATVPQAIWDQLVAKTSTGSGTGTWKRYDPATHDPQLHPATVEMLQWLTNADRGDNRVDPATVTFCTRPDGEPYLQATRPDKDAGVSGTIGFVRPGVLWVFSTKWPGLSANKAYTIHELTDVDSDTADSTENTDAAEAVARRVVLTSAADIKPKPTTWTWTGRLPTGSLALIAGPEGTGKSTCGYWIAARVTRGELPGIHHGTAKDVLIAATEDSWERTIVPRLIAAGADLARVWRIEVVTSLGTGGYLTLPKDVPGLADHVAEKGAALILLDPIMSRLDAGLDTHKDAETRRALEPISALADRTGVAIIGLIHFNKGGSAEVLNNVMASKAFTAVARSVSTVIRDPNDDTGRVRIFGTPKSNLGRDDLPLLPFQLAEYTFDNDDGERIATSRIEWLTEREGNMADLMRQSREHGQERTVVAEVADWLAEYLHTQGGIALRKDIIDAGRRERFSEDQLKRGFKRLGLKYRSQKIFGRGTLWMTAEEAVKWDEAQAQDSQSTVRAPVRGESLTTLTTPTGGQSAQSAQLEQSETAPARALQLDDDTPLCDTCGRRLHLIRPGRTTCALCERLNPSDTPTTPEEDTA